MAQYRAKGPDGRMYKFEGPEGLSNKDASFFLGQYLNLGGMEETPEPAPLVPQPPKGESGFIPSIKRAAYQTSALVGDVLPAMAARAVGADEYAQRQMAEAAATMQKAQELFPAEVASYKDIKGVGDALTYVKEAIGEAIPSLIPSLLTGGAAALIARPAVAAATTAATEFAAQEVTRAAAKNILTRETLDGIRDAALNKGVTEARKIALKYQATGALAGSAAQNVPEVFQNVFEETGQMDLGAALAFGGFNSVLDAVLPLQLLRKADLAGVPREQIIGAWYKRAGKGALTGFATEGGTEAVQEMSSAAAEKFVDNNKQFFSEKNFERFINAGLKGGIGGAAITAGADVLTGRAAPPPTAPETEETERKLPPALEAPPAKLTKIERLRADLAETEARLADNVARGRKGFPITQPQKKIERLKQEIADEEAKAAAEGAPSVAGPIAGTTGAGFEILSPTDPRLAAPAAGAGAIEPSGVAPTTEVAGEPAGREAAPPAAVATDYSKLTDEQLADIYDDFLSTTEETNGARAELEKRGKFAPIQIRNLEARVRNPNISEDNRAAAAAELAQLKGQSSAPPPPKPLAAPTEIKTTTPAGPKSLGDLAPEVQDSIMEKRDELYELQVEGASEKQISQKLRTLNALETQFGLEPTKPATLGAKRTAIEEEEVESEAAIREAQERRDRTKPVGYPAENLPANAQENYDAVAEEQRGQAEEANAVRTRLAKEYDEANQAHREALKAQRELEQRIVEAEQAGDADALSRLAQEENEVNRREAETLDRLAEAGQALEVHGDERFVLPPWYKLDADDKDVYFSNIKNNTPAEHRAAAKALIEYREKAKRETRGKPLSADERRIRRNYNENRAFYAKLFNMQFPTWDALSDKAKEIFTAEVSRERTTKSGEKKTSAVLTGIQQDVAFAKTGVQILLENKNQDTARALRAIEDQMKRREALAKETEENRKQLDSLKRTFDRFRGRIGKGIALPQWLFDRVASNEDSAQAVLNYLRSADWLPKTTVGSRRIYKALAQSLYAMKLKTKIKIVPDGSLVEGRIAEYDPSIDTVYVTESNFDAPTLLHELIHAGTVKVLNLYITGQHKSLTEEQLRAAEHLEDMMYELAPTMAERFPLAFEVVGANEDGTPKYSVMEFVAYGLTDESMQDALHEAAESKVVVTNLPEKPSAWSKFKLLIADILGMRKTYASFLPEKSKLGKVPYSYFLEVAAAFEDVLATPTEPIFISPLASAGPAAPTLPPSARSDEEIARAALEQVELKDFGIKSIVKALGTRRGFEWFVKQFQNERRVLKQISERADKFGMLKRIGTKINDVYGQLTRSTGQAVYLYDVHVRGLSENLDKKIEAYAARAGIPVKDALSRLHLIFEARHEPERRAVKYLLNVPLDTDTKNINLDGTLYSAAGLREEIMRRVTTNDLRGRTPGDYRGMLDQVIANGLFDRSKEAALFDINNAKYSVIAERTPDEIAAIRRVYDIPDVAEEIDAIKTALDKVKAKTKALDRVSNYWSEPVNNIVEFYDFKDYVPFKGRKGQETSDPLEIGSRRIGGELQEGQDPFTGRISESENPLLQIKADAARAAMRAGRRELTLAIKNAVKDGILKGEVKEAAADFSQRYNDTLKQELGGTNSIFHYNSDGTIDVIKLKNKDQLEAIRRTYRETSPILDIANQITSGVGQGHTRFNPAFAPKNFIVDSLTNAFALGAEMGPKAAGRLIQAVAREVASGGFKRSLLFSKLYSEGKFQEIDRLGATDPYMRDLVEYVTLGGRVSYLQGVAAKGALDKLMTEVGRSGVLRTKDQIANFFDIYNDIFELSSRVAAYRTMRQEFLAKGESMEEAQVHAAEYAKNFANFEQVGRWGKNAGALFMFFRPAATGAVRAIDALRPAFGFNEETFRREAANEGRSTEQIDKAVAKMREETRNARVMSATLVGFGVTMYLMAAMMSGDDEEGRNKTATDDMARWTRYARFHIPGTDTIIQMPWAFGLGAFSAAGAQIAAAASGNASIRDALSNITTIGLDSFLPLPFSRISPIDNFPAFMIDSVTPSAARPFLEYVMNLDGLGREIYNNRQTRYGDAFTGGDNIPEMYKSAARTLFQATNGAVDWSPNTMYFFANNFFDGQARIVSTGVNLAMTTSGQKDFDLKNDTLFLSSFVGTKSNVDARQFSKAEDYIKGLEKRVNSLKDKPEMLAQYVEENPDKYMLVQFYNHEVNGALKKIRTAANEVRADGSLTPKERKAQLEQLITMQNTVKRRLIEGFETLGYER